MKAPSASPLSAKGIDYANLGLHIANSVLPHQALARQNHGLGLQGLAEAIGHQPDHNGYRKTESAYQDTTNPLRQRQWRRLEGDSAVLHNQDLNRNGDGHDDNEVVVIADVREGVQRIVHATAVDFVEQLAKYKGGEDNGAADELPMLVRRVEMKHGRPEVEEKKGRHHLIDGHADDHLPHLWGD